MLLLPSASRKPAIAGTYVSESALSIAENQSRMFSVMARFILAPEI